MILRRTIQCWGVVVAGVLVLVVAMSFVLSQRESRIESLGPKQAVLPSKSDSSFSIEPIRSEEQLEANDQGKLGEDKLLVHDHDLVSNQELAESIANGADFTNVGDDDLQSRITTVLKETDRSVVSTARHLLEVEKPIVAAKIARRDYVRLTNGSDWTVYHGPTSTQTTEMLDDGTEVIVQIGQAESAEYDIALKKWTDAIADRTRRIRELLDSHSAKKE